MNKDKFVIFCVVLLCVGVINIATQAMLNDGYTEEELSQGGLWLDKGHREHTLTTRLLAVTPSALLLLIVFLAFSKDDPWLIWIDKKIAGGKQ